MPGQCRALSLGFLAEGVNQKYGALGFHSLYQLLPEGTSPQFLPSASQSYPESCPFWESGPSTSVPTL